MKRSYEENCWSPSTQTVFKALASARLCAAVWNNITDCDETYNYWEPVTIQSFILLYDQLNSIFLAFSYITCCLGLVFKHGNTHHYMPCGPMLIFYFMLFLHGYTVLFSNLIKCWFFTSWGGCWLLLQVHLKPISTSKLSIHTFKPSVKYCLYSQLLTVIIFCLWKRCSRAVRPKNWTVDFRFSFV